MRRYRYRSFITGKVVPTWYALLHPKGHYREAVIIGVLLLAAIADASYVADGPISGV